MTKTRQFLSVFLSLALLAGSSPILFGYQTPPSAPPTSGAGVPPTEPAPMDAAELQALVAPIALYPDALVAQVLGAATFPDQIAVANYWLGQNKTLSGNALAQAVDTQTWAPSVKALTQFPSVLGSLANNLAWTSSLGEAYHNQQPAVMAAVQTLRAQAKAAGNLTSSPQITVQQQSPQVIVIQPANPQVIYVPQYNPTVIYGTPYVTPGYSAGDMAAVGLLSFGAGIAMGAMMSSSWNAWGCDWHGGAVVYHGGAYYGNAAWHGGYYNDAYHSGYGYNNSAYHNDYNNDYSHNNSYNNSYNKTNAQNNYNKNSGNTYNKNVNNVNVNHDSGGSNSWARGSGGGTSNAFSGMSHFGGDSGGGWSSHADSSRGWGSMHSSGFSGGGGFRGGGFRR